MLRHSAPMHGGVRSINHAAFVSAWKSYSRRLLSLCLRWVGGDPQDAEDVLGSVAVRALEDVASRDEVISSYPAWLTRLARNTAMDFHRQRACRQKAVELYSATYGEDMILEVESAETAHVRAELHSWLHTSLDRLPRRLREVSRRRFVDDAAYDEIAEESGITNENVRKRIQEARAILGRRLDAYENG